jgi:glucokinase
VTALAADFGGRRIKLGVVRNGQVLARDIIPAEADEALAQRLSVVARKLLDLCAQAGIRPGDCQGLGIGYPSLIDVRRARIMDHFGKFGDAAALDLRAWARQTFGLPLAIDNDARAAMIGEWQYGAGRGAANLVMITLGTGIGVSALVEGRPLRGAHGQASILGGHLTLRYGGRPCVCGNIGCAEAEASTAALEQLAREHPGFTASALATQNAIDYASVFRLAAKGDACAKALRDHSLQVWSSLAVSLIHAYDPELIILGGGVMGSAEHILPALIEYTHHHAHTPWAKVPIVRAQTGDDAALLAAPWLLQNSPTE